MLQRPRWVSRNSRSSGDSGGLLWWGLCSIIGRCTSDLPFGSTAAMSSNKSHPPPLEDDNCQQNRTGDGEHGSLLFWLFHFGPDPSNHPERSAVRTF
jgi:hypothetical protein